MLRTASRSELTTALSVLLSLAACSPEAGADSDANAGSATESAATQTGAATVALEVNVDQEAEGRSALVRATMQIADLRIVPAGDTVSGTGHHHLYLDTELTPAGQPVPSIPGSVVHLGDGSAEYMFEDVAPGAHRMIAVVADGLHIPLQPWVVDTVDFVIR